MDAEPSSFSKHSKKIIVSIVLLLIVGPLCFYFYQKTGNANYTDVSAAKQKAIDSVTNKFLPKKIATKKIYLTFDDGPNNGTDIVLAIIKQEQIPVSAFIIGEQVYYNPTQTNRFNAVNTCSFFEIANHSYTHAFHNNFKPFYRQPSAVVNDFNRCADSLKFKNNITRTPGRNIWRMPSVRFTDLKASTIAADSLYSRGYTIMGWDIEWQYNKTHRLVQTEAQMLQMVDNAFAKNETRVKDNLVILTHDRTFLNPIDSAQLHQFIKALKLKTDYEFELVSKYPTAIIDTITKK